MDVAERLVDQIQVEVVVQAEAPQRRVEGPHGVLLAVSWTHCSASTSLPGRHTGTVGEVDNTKDVRGCSSPRRGRELRNG
jgi:hypothetical protein